MSRVLTGNLNKFAVEISVLKPRKLWRFYDLRQFNMSAVILKTTLTTSYFLSLVSYFFPNVTLKSKRQLRIAPDHIVTDIDHGLFQT